MNNRVRSLLEALETTATGEYVLTRPDGHPYKRWSLDFQFAMVRQAAGIRGLRFHDLRHTFASRLSARGVDLVTIKELLGHTSITTTMRYAHSPSHRHAVRLLDTPVPESMTKL